MKVERAAIDARPGYFGKLPILGDFVSRRLSNGFIGAWDGWLQRCVLTSKERLGETWLTSFLGAPMWRFLLAPGVVSNEAWVGILIPSVDRVGRYFPLTIAAPLLGEVDPVRTFWASGPTYAQFEELGWSALDVNQEFDEFEARVAAAATPVGAPASDLEDVTTPLPQESPRYCKVEVVGAWGDHGGLVQLQSQVVGICQPFCLWASEGETPAERIVLCTEKLPSGAAFCAMLDLQWGQHGWQSLA